MLQSDGKLMQKKQGRNVKLGGGRRKIISKNRISITGYVLHINDGILSTFYTSKGENIREKDRRVIWK